ncbi:MAG: hypothetical protein WCW01_00550 [Gammaproteobacteria bacterium]
MFTAKFTDSLSTFVDTKNGGQPVELYLFLSMGLNRKGENVQVGAKLDDFIGLVNRNRLLAPIEKGGQPRLAISKVRVVLSGEGLFEVYVGPGEAKKADDEWIAKNASRLDNLDPAFGFKSKEDILYWRDITNNELYPRAKEDVAKLYGADPVFKKIVDDLILEHSHRYQIDKQNKGAAVEAAKEYLFTESAAFLCCGKVVCYPAPSFNSASGYVLQKLVGTGNPPYPGALYLGYEFKPPSPTVRPGSGSNSSRPPVPSSPPRLLGKSSFFNGRSPSPPVPDFSEKMSFTKENHVWKGECVIQFNEPKRAEAIATLVTSIDAARKNYEGEVSKSFAPVTLEYSQKFIGFHISYRIHISDPSALKVDPFSVLIRAVEAERAQQQEMAVTGSTTFAQPQKVVPSN